MRRNWLTVLLFVLALAFQAFAPATANIVGGKGGAGASSAIAGAFVQICATTADESQSPVRSGQHRDFCPLCQSHGDGPAPLVARPAVVVVAPVTTSTLTWTVAAHDLPTLDPDRSRRARAPPSNS